MAWKIADWEKFEYYPDPRSSVQWDGGLRYVKFSTAQKPKITRLKKTADGRNALLVWFIMIEVWGQGHRSRRADGYLWGPYDEMATAEDIAEATGLPTGQVRKALPLLTQVGWLQELTSANTSTNTSSVRITKQSIAKHNTIEQTNARFDRFWKAYPKKKSKGDAEKAFVKINPDEQLLATIISTIERAKRSREWLKDKGQFIPHPATWLNRQGWFDDYDVVGQPLITPEQAEAAEMTRLKRLVASGIATGSDQSKLEEMLRKRGE